MVLSAARPGGWWKQTFTSSTNSACSTLYYRNACVRWHRWTISRRFAADWQRFLTFHSMIAFGWWRTNCYLAKRWRSITDYLVGEETHRLIVQLNRGLRDEDGGFFMLFNSFEPQDVYRILRPVGGSGIGFEIGLNSNHAVSQIHRGERYTLVYSFYARFDTPRDSGSR